MLTVLSLSLCHTELKKSSGANHDTFAANILCLQRSYYICNKHNMTVANVYVCSKRTMVNPRALNYMNVKFFFWVHAQYVRPKQSLSATARRLKQTPKKIP